MSYFTTTNWKFQLTAENIGAFYANNSNSVKIDAYQKFRIQGGKSISIGGVNADLYAGVNNLFNVKYFDNIRLNAFGKRYYEPAPGRNLFFGISMGL